MDVHPTENENRKRRAENYLKHISEIAGWGDFSFFACRLVRFPGRGAILTNRITQLTAIECVHGVLRGRFFQFAYN